MSIKTNNTPFTLRRKRLVTESSENDQIVPNTFDFKRIEKRMKEPPIGSADRSHNGWDFIQLNMHLISKEFSEWFDGEFERTTIPNGTHLYHGTHMSLPFPDGSKIPSEPAYFCYNQEETYKYIIATEFWNVGTYKTNHIITVYNIGECKNVIRDKMVELFKKREKQLLWPEESDSVIDIIDEITEDDIDGAICCIQVEGWITGTDGSSEVMLCKPYNHLLFKTSTDADFLGDGKKI